MLEPAELVRTTLPASCLAIFPTPIDAPLCSRTQNYFASRFGAPGSGMGSVFLSRKAFLGAPATIPAGAGDCTATITTEVAGGLYVPLVRFESVCRPPACFETQFQLSIAQGGDEEHHPWKTVFAGVYGDLAQISNFGTHPPKGGKGVMPSNMNIWLGQDSRVLLRPGKVKLTLLVNEELSPANSARRNVDAVMLSSNLTDMAIRAANGGDVLGNIPFDGALTQKGDIFVRLVNHQDGVPMNLSLPFGIEHSSYWTHVRNHCLHSLLSSLASC